MECSISVDHSGGGPSCHTQVIRRARKEHKCCECKRVIGPRESYTPESGIWDGEPMRFKTCMDCMSVRDALFCEWEYGNIWREVREWINETCGDLPPKTHEMTMAARLKLAGYWDEWWEEYEENYGDD